MREITDATIHNQPMLTSQVQSPYAEDNLISAILVQILQ